MRAFFFLTILVALATPAVSEDEVFPGTYRLILPESIPVLTELETNIYLESTFLALNPDNLLADVTARRGHQQEDRWTWKPSADPGRNNIGAHRLTIELRDQANRVAGRAVTTLKVRSRKVPSGYNPKSLLIIGDSLTNASIYSGRIAELANEDQLPLTLIGTRGPGAEAQESGGDGSGNRHEGYGGWTAHRFATHHTGIARGGEYRKCGSPFLYKDGDSQPVLDFPRYCREFNGDNAPDFVTILLGCNDTFHGTDETIDEKIDVMFEHYETLLTMIHNLNPETKIGAILPMPPSASQDAFGANYGAGQTRWQYRRNQHRVLERMTESFGGREPENVFLVPAWLNLDPVYGFPSTREKVNARSEETTIRPNNGVHPSAVGYRQMGDAIYAWLRSFD